MLLNRREKRNDLFDDDLWRQQVNVVGVRCFLRLNTHWFSLYELWMFPQSQAQKICCVVRKKQELGGESLNNLLSPLQRLRCECCPGPRHSQVQGRARTATGVSGVSRFWESLTSPVWCWRARVPCCTCREEIHGIMASLLLSLSHWYSALKTKQANIISVLWTVNKTDDTCGWMVLQMLEKTTK